MIFKFPGKRQGRARGLYDEQLQRQKQEKAARAAIRQSAADRVAASLFFRSEPGTAGAVPAVMTEDAADEAGHGLPRSKEARSDALPEGLRRGKGVGEDKAAPAQPAQVVTPKGRPYPAG